jgi:transcriptional regulator GlxA family with amidase domain
MARRSAPAAVSPITPDAALDAVEAPHTLLVPGGHGTRTPDPALVEWLRHNAPDATRLVSVCTGAFLLAAAGLLDGRTVTTHWQRCDQLAACYPAVTVDPEPIYVRDGHLTTSAGVTAGIDLALALVEADLDRDTALTVARQLVVFLRRPGNQTQFSAHLRGQTAHRTPLCDVQHWITEHPDADLSVDTLARRANLSPRQFARAFTAETGATPGQYVDATRLGTARRLLEDTRDTIDRVARHAGYGTPEAMRRAFHRTLGVSPAEYRRRF